MTVKPKGVTPIPALFLVELALLFIAFKLAHVGDVASWSWWWVLAPIWMTWPIRLVLRIVIALLKRKVKAWEDKADRSEKVQARP